MIPNYQIQPMSISLLSVRPLNTSMSGGSVLANGTPVQKYVTISLRFVIIITTGWPSWWTTALSSSLCRSMWLMDISFLFQFVDTTLIARAQKWVIRRGGQQIRLSGTSFCLDARSSEFFLFFFSFKGSNFLSRPLLLDYPPFIPHYIYTLHFTYFILCSPFTVSLVYHSSSLFATFSTLAQFLVC